MRNDHRLERSSRSNRSGPDARLFEASWLGSSWTGQIPVASVDVLLPLFGATAPAPLLPAQPSPREFFEPVAGVAMREMFETAVFLSHFGPQAQPEALAFSRKR
jgi:hypothetical protein